jgi:hypothetical protein
VYELGHFKEGSATQSRNHEILKERAKRWLEQRTDARVYSEYAISIPWFLSNRLELAESKRRGIYINRQWTYSLDVAEPISKVCIECGHIRMITPKLKNLLKMGWIVYVWEFGKAEPVLVAERLDNIVYI